MFTVHLKFVIRFAVALFLAILLKNLHGKLERLKNINMVLESIKAIKVRLSDAQVNDQFSRIRA